MSAKRIRLVIVWRQGNGDSRFHARKGLIGRRELAFQTWTFTQIHFPDSSMSNRLGIDSLIYVRSDSGDILNPVSPFILILISPYVYPSLLYYFLTPYKYIFSIGRSHYFFFPFPIFFCSLSEYLHDVAKVILLIPY